MTEMRLDPLSGRWVVISSARATRPDAFVLHAQRLEHEPLKPCPFCPGNEEETPPALVVADDDGQWQVRVIANKYPAFEGDEPFVVENRGPVFTAGSAGGVHEVLVLSPNHQTSWADLTDEQAGLVMTVIRDRMAEHATSTNLRYSQAIVNAGREAGASVEHPHGQLLGMSFVPREVAEEQARFARFTAHCLLCTTIESEESVNQRVVYRDEHVMVLCPYWSSAPYEMLVIPRHHSPHLHTASDDDVTSVGVALRKALRALTGAIGDVAYNLVFHSAPFRKGDPFHWHVHVVPKATTRAGFEMGTGVAINIVPPEMATTELLSELDR
ncbi:MAG: galactose-1-phosphate uridylyltransferase [Actinomycetes bacterium]